MGSCWRGDHIKSSKASSWMGDEIKRAHPTELFVHMLIHSAKLGPYTTYILHTA